MIVNIRASKPRMQPGVEGEEVFLEDCYQILFLPKPFSLLYFILLLDQVESVESAIEPDRKEIKRRRPHEKTFRKVTNMHQNAPICKLPQLKICFHSTRCGSSCERPRRTGRRGI